MKLSTTTIGAAAAIFNWRSLLELFCFHRIGSKDGLWSHNKISESTPVGSACIHTPHVTSLYT